MVEGHIRWCIRRDLPEILQIEASVDASWSEEDFLTHIRQNNCIAMVVEGNFWPNDGKVLGFMVYELHKHHLELLRIAVHPTYRRQGLASQMLARLESKLDVHRRNRVAFQVSERSSDLHLLLKNCGFEAVRVIRERDMDDQYRFVKRAALATNLDAAVSAS